MASNNLADIFESMLAMRRFEETVFELHEAGAFMGHYHLYIGQEATGAAVIAALDESDPIYSTHRNHGHAIARGIDPAAAFAEILGKATGTQGGRGGTFHLADPDHAMPHTSALVGGAVPLAAGAALAAKQKGEGGVAVALFGDGCFEEGVVYESLNLARMWGLPVLFVCENNTPGALEKAKGGNNTSNLPDGRVADTPRALKIETHEVDGGDAGAVLDLITDCRARAAKDGTPVFIEALTERWPGNMYSFPSMVTGLTDLTNAWKGGSQGEHAQWFNEIDPVLRLARQLLADGVLGQDEITAMDDRVCEAMAAARQDALAAGLPDIETLGDHLMASSGEARS